MKIITPAILGIVVALVGFVVYDSIKTLKNEGVDVTPIVDKIPLSGLVQSKEEKEKTENPFGDSISIMLLGVDRRARDEGYRTDIMILATANIKTNKVSLISLPRDLWYDGGRLNAVFYNNGWESMQEAVEYVTGIKPQKYILTDFKDFSWVVDAMGGVEVNVETTFTDTSYPVDATKGYQTITFVSGPEKLTGERALIYSRSRKGNNGEGSDWARMKRQHLILKGMIEAISQPKSIFNPMVVEKAFETVTTNRMDTDLTVQEAKFLWDFYKDRDLYTINSMFLDYEYVFSPPMEDYGGAWVLASKDGSYLRFQSDVKKSLEAEVIPQ